MAMGLPVVGFETGRKTELLDKVGHGSLIRLKDTEAIAAAVQRILSLPDRGRAMGELGAEYCRAHDFQQFVEMVVSIYTDLYRKRLRSNAINA
jgi:glycosyltransferase involved in cell wall biosynthesis